MERVPRLPMPPRFASIRLVSWPVPTSTDIYVRLNVPTDGTTNFVHGFPFACISIGFLYKKQPVIGVIYNPFLDQLYSALKGHGAFLDHVKTGERTKLPVYASRPLPSLSKAIIGIEWGADRSPDVFNKKLSSFAKCVRRARVWTPFRPPHSGWLEIMQGRPAGKWSVH